jgi:hypothetical protein
MASYLLLRNNKESGPYTLEALIQLGLKPYDLVWVEGKSAAWRYPSEVDGLKFYAPAVEEQPFDRFYKKPAEQKAEKEEQKPSAYESTPQIITETKTAGIQETVSQQKVQEENVEVKMPKKQVYVSMPANGGKTVIIKKTEQPVASNGNGSLNDTYSKSQETNKKAETVVNSSLSYSELVSDYNKQQYTEKKTPVQQTALPVDDYPLEKKYSQSLDDIKDMYVQTLADRKRKNAQKKVIMNLAKKVLPFAAVLIIGILVGVFIMNKKGNNENVLQTQQNSTPAQNETAKTKPDLTPTDTQAQQQVPAQTDANQQQIAENKPVENNTVDLSKTTPSQKDNALAEQQNSLTPSSAAKKNTKKEAKATLPAGNGGAELSQPKSIEPDPVTGERNKVVRSDNDNNSTQTASKQFSNSLMKQVSVASNDYKRGTFGGIHDLQLTVTNNSNYLLDNVVVELQILKPNEQPLKTDNIRFSPVPPNGSLTLAIPATSRGVKVAYRVTHVESKSAVNDTAGLK